MIPQKRKKMILTKYDPKKPQDFTIMTRQQVRDFDAYAINTLHIPGVVLMENAGTGCTQIILDHLKNPQASKVSIFCGTGNNGGDGYVIARHLANQNIDVQTIICGDTEKIKGDALINLEIIRRMNLTIEQLEMSAPDIPDRINTLTAGSDMIVDAIFGTGLQGQLRPQHANLITCINARNLPIIAVDIPSGLDCDAGIPLPISIEAKATVTFVALKKGFATCTDSIKATGKIYIASIGIQPHLKRRTLTSQ